MLSRLIRRRNSSGASILAFKPSRRMSLTAFIRVRVASLNNTQSTGKCTLAFKQVVSRKYSSRSTGSLTFNDLAHLRCLQPMRKALHFALGGHPHLVQRINQAEPLVEGISGQRAAKASIIFLQQRSQKRATQCPPATLLKSLLLSNRGRIVCP